MPAPGQLPDAPEGRYVRRYAVFLVGQFVMALGIALSSRASLGTTPISAPPYVLSLVPGSLTLGTWTIIMHSLFILAQIALLRGRYEWIQLLQVVVAIVFGLFIDVAMQLTAWAVPEAYWLQWVQLVCGAVVLAAGVAMQFVARVLMNAGEGTVAAISRVTGLAVGTTKILFDSTLVVIGVALSLVFFHGLVGVREGTVASALLVGFLVGRFLPLASRAMDRLLEVGAAPQPKSAGNRATAQ